MGTVKQLCGACKDTPAARYQDDRYGPNVRVMNLTLDTKPRTAFCTVCGLKRVVLGSVED